MRRAPIKGTDYDETGLPMLVGFDDNPPPVVPPVDTVPRDKLLHLALGAIAVACALAGLWVLDTWGVGALLAYTSTAVGVLYECQQKFRGEGQVELADAAATALPGWAAWVLLSV